MHALRHHGGGPLASGGGVGAGGGGGQLGHPGGSGAGGGSCKVSALQHHLELRFQPFLACGPVSACSDRHHERVQREFSIEKLLSHVLKEQRNLVMGWAGQLLGEEDLTWTGGKGRRGELLPTPIPSSLQTAAHPGQGPRREEGWSCPPPRPQTGQAAGPK